MRTVSAGARSRAGEGREMSGVRRAPTQRASRFAGRALDLLDGTIRLIVLATPCLLMGACGDSSADSDAAGSASASASPAAAVADPAGDPADIEVCRLLTDEQVATVLPGHEGGMEAGSGKQLFGDETRSYKCSYDVEASGSTHFFTIDLTVGPVGVMSYESEREMAQQEGEIHRELEIASGGWVEVGDEWMGMSVPYVNVSVLKNSTEISLLLIVPDAHDKIDAVIDLAASVAAALD